MTPVIEKNHVHAVYDAIADHWDNTRYKAWPKVASFVSSVAPGKLLLDIGCGNGKYFGCVKNQTVIGCDICRPLLNLAQQKRPIDVFQADALKVPFRDKLFDSVICIAVIHHISTVERRQELIKEAVRVCTLRGQVLVYGWAFEQDISSKHFEKQDVLVPWHYRKPRDKLEKGIIHHRYCHVFIKGELRDLVESCGLVVHQEWYDKGNWAVIYGRK